MPDYPFPINTEQTAISITYRNPSLVANEVLPLTPVSKKFSWTKYTAEDSYTVPSTLVGRKSQPNQVSFGGTLETSSTNDYALDDPIPYDDIEADNYGFDPVSTATMFLSDLLELDREVRTAEAVFDASAYPAGMTTTLSGTSQHSDYSNTNPMNDWLEWLDVPLMRPTDLLLGNDYWRLFRQHPKVVEYVRATGAGGTDAAGMVSRDQVVDVLEIERLHVGKSKVNTARRGQSPVISRVWGKHGLAFYRNDLAGPQRGTTFGFTGQWGSRIAGAIPDPDVGMRGGTRLRVGWSIKEVIAANDLAFFVQNAVA